MGVGGNLKAVSASRVEVSNMKICYSLYYKCRPDITMGLERGSIMVLILDGNPEIGAHVRSNLCYLICLRH